MHNENLCAMGELSSAEQVKLLCSLPGIHHNVVSLVDTLNAFVSEARNNEVRLQRRVDELAGRVLDLRQEMKLLKESAIMAVKQPFSKSRLGKEIKSAGSSSTTSKSTRTSSPGQSKPRASDSAKLPNQQVKHVGTHTEPRTRSAATPWHATKTVPSGDTEMEYSESDAGDTGLLPVSVKPVFGATAANAGPNQDTLPAAAGSVEPETGNTEQEEVDAINDNSWQLVAAAPPRRRRAVVFVGNLSSTCTMEGLTEFVQRRSVAATGDIIDVHSCNVHTAASGKVSARVTIHAACLATVTSANFWPRPLYCRTWKFNPPKKSSGNDKAHSSSDGGSGDGNDNAHSSSDGGSGDDSSGNDCGNCNNLKLFVTSLNIGFLNICSLRYKLHALDSLAHQHNWDVVGVAETWLDSTISDGEICIPGYSVVRCDRPDRQRGGTCLYYKTSLPVTYRSDLHNSHLEATWIAIGGGRHQHLIG